MSAPTQDPIEKDMARVAACWQACAGIPTSALREGVIAEMVAALDGIRKEVWNTGAGSERQLDRIDEHAWAVLAKLGAAIAKAERK